MRSSGRATYKFKPTPHASGVAAEVYLSPAPAHGVNFTAA